MRVNKDEIRFYVFIFVLLLVVIILFISVLSTYIETDSHAIFRTSFLAVPWVRGNEMFICLYFDKLHK